MDVQMVEQYQSYMNRCDAMAELCSDNDWDHIRDPLCDVANAFQGALDDGVELSEESSDTFRAMLGLYEQLVAFKMGQLPQPSAIERASNA